MNTGALAPPIDICIDAISVYDKLSCADLSIPSETSLLIHVYNIRDRLQNRCLHGVLWVDTRYMVAEGLNKGSVPRVAPRDAMSGRRHQQYPSLRTQGPQQPVVTGPKSTFHGWTNTVPPGSVARTGKGGWGTVIQAP